MTDKRLADRADLDKMLALINERIPNALTATFETSDQNTYGFVLREVTLSTGEIVDSGDVFSELADASWDVVGDIDWNGVMGENAQGYAVVHTSAITPIQEYMRVAMTNTLSTIDALVPSNVVHYAVEDVRHSLQKLLKLLTTVKADGPFVWTFFGHWQGGDPIVDYALPGELIDQREDQNDAFPEGLWAQPGHGSTQDEARIHAIAQLDL